MGKQGTPLSVAEMKNIVHMYCVLKERKTPNIREEIHQLLGYSVKKIREVITHYEKTGTILPRKPKKPWNKGKTLTTSTLNIEDAHNVRLQIIKWDQQGEMVTTQKIRKWLAEVHNIYVKKTTLCWQLRRMGFKYGRIKHSNLIEKEKPHIKAWRARYCDEWMMAHLFELDSTYDDVWTDESYVHTFHNKKYSWYDPKIGRETGATTNIGERWIMLAAGNRNGWIPDTTVIFAAHKRTGDYHGNVNSALYQHWFTELCKKLPQRSRIHIDNAPYHKTNPRDQPKESEKGRTSSLATKQRGGSGAKMAQR